MFAKVQVGGSSGVGTGLMVDRYYPLDIPDYRSLFSARVLPALKDPIGGIVLGAVCEACGLQGREQSLMEVITKQEAQLAGKRLRANGAQTEALRMLSGLILEHWILQVRAHEPRFTPDFKWIPASVLVSVFGGSTTNWKWAFKSHTGLMRVDKAYQAKYAECFRLTEREYAQWKARNRRAPITEEQLFEQKAAELEELVQRERDAVLPEGTLADYRGSYLRDKEQTALATATGSF